MLKATGVKLVLIVASGRHAPGPLLYAPRIISKQALGFLQRVQFCLGYIYTLSITRGGHWLIGRYLDADPELCRSIF